MSYGQSISSPIPTVGVTPRPDYAEQINAWMSEIETILESKVTPSGMNINAELDMQNQVLLNADCVRFENNTSTKTGISNSYRLYVTNGELYFTDGSANVVKLTDGGALNAASIRGILGDYGADTTAQADYTSATGIYRFLKTVSTSTRAAVEAGTLRLAGTGSSPSNFLTVAPHASSSNYTITLPQQPPASGTYNSLLRMDTSGNVTITDDPSVDDLTCDTLSVTTTSTLTGNVTVGSNSDVTVQGTGRFKHGTAYRPMSLAEAVISPDEASDWSLNGCAATALAEPAVLYFPIPLMGGAIVTQFDLYVIKADTDTLELTVKRKNITTNSDTNVATASSSLSGARTLTISTDFKLFDGTAAGVITSGPTLQSNHVAYVEVRATTGDVITGALITYDFVTSL